MNNDRASENRVTGRMPIKRQRILLVSVITLAIMVRVGCYIAFSSVFAFEKTGTIQGFDAYDILAQNLLKTGIFGNTAGVADASLPPSYPYLLSVVYGIFGRGSFQVIALNTLLDVVTIICLVQIGQKLLPRYPLTGFIAAFFFAIYPYFVFQSLSVIDTSLFTTTLHAFVLTMIMLRNSTESKVKMLWLMLLGGLILGLAALDRPIVAALGLAIFIWFVLTLGIGEGLKRLLPVAVVSVVTLLPWTIRNYQVYHAFVNVANTGGMNFWFGNSQYTVPFYRAGYQTQWAQPEQPPTSLNEIESDHWMLNLGLNFLREHPDQIPELIWVKTLAYWSINIFPTKNPVSGSSPISDYSGTARVTLGSQGDIVVDGIPENDALNVYSQSLFDTVGRDIHIIFFGSLLILALFGIFLTIPYWRDVSLIWIIQITMTIAYVIFSGPTTRYRVPTDPLLFLFSAYTILHVIAYVRTQRETQLLMSSANP